MKFISRALILGFFVFQSAKGQAVTNSAIGHYSTGLIPNSYGACDALKNEVGAAFVDAAQVELISSACDKSSRGSVITLNYVDKNTPIEFSSTRGRSVTDDVAGRGYIRTQEECEQRKSAVVEQFKIATGLQPFFSYCMEDEAANYSTHPWHVAIEAVGVGALKYQFIDRMLSDGMSTDPSTLISEIKQYFQSRPETILVDAVYRMDNLSFARFGITLFAKKYVSVNKYELLATRRQGDCAIEVNELKAAAIRAGMPLIGHGCQSRSGDIHRSFLITETRAKLSYDSTGISYQTMEACRSARTKVFEDMKKALGETLVGIICSDVSDGPTAFVIQKPAN